ncbi:hypothetical protein DL96DRAFT_1580353 [Flagelloscypha sp. PMI_526]|nr:hypothetical protein DL96DRAFT_1580353 [Flagelloscypha sp. PMI_526]
MSCLLLVALTLVAIALPRSSDCLHSLQNDLDHHPTLTGYRFLCMATGVGYLLAKSILTYLYKPESLINIADIVYGVSSIGLLFWLGLYEHRPRLLPQLIYRFLFKESIWSYVTLSCK